METQIIILAYLAPDFKLTLQSQEKMSKYFQLKILFSDEMNP